MHDSLGDRMKSFYEDRTRVMLPRRTYTIIRLDGKAFSSLTAKLKRPLDLDFASIMHDTTKYLRDQVQGCKFLYQQSDEISVVMVDFDGPQTDAWFDNNLQKICSTSASICTYRFNDTLSYKKECNQLTEITKPGFFDARVFTIPSWKEVVNYLRWRQQDCVRNATQNLARSLYSHKELDGKNIKEQLEMVTTKGKSFKDFPDWFRLGYSLSDYNHDAALDFMTPETVKLLETIIPKQNNDFNPFQQGS